MIVISSAVAEELVVGDVHIDQAEHELCNSAPIAEEVQKEIRDT